MVVGTPGEVELKAWLSRAAIRSSDSLELWISIKNSGKKQLDDLRVVGCDLSGFVPSGTCWLAGVPSCRPVSPANPPQAGGLERALAPGATAMVFAEIKPSVHSGGPGPVTLRVTWQLAGQAPVTEAVKIPRVEVAPHAYHGIVIAYALLKDLGLPLVLTILAFLFQQILHEGSRSESARNAMLPTATTNASKYFLPAASAARSLERVLKEAEALSPEPPDNPRWWAKHQEAFFYFLFMFKCMRDGNTVGGGFFFRDTLGENLAAGCWGAVYRRAIEHFGYLQLSHAQDLLEGHETISRFLDRLRSSDRSLEPARQATRDVADGFLAWAGGGNGNPDRGLIQVLGEVLEYEANRLYLGWYDKVEIPSQETLARWKQVIEAFQAAYPDPLRGKNLVTSLAAYAAVLPKGG
ncbi:MAG: hypothetical protein M3O15_05875 [Acidobacteriota bacterium]|nr:hypothetical protein [Acidobacteriota bacterium]